MTDAAIRPIVVAAGVAVLLVGGYYRLKSLASPEKLDRRQEGLFILATLRPVGLSLWGGVIAFMINPAWMAWSSMPAPVWVRWAGVAFAAVAIVLLAWTLRGLGPNLTDTVVTRQAHTLVMHGAYRWVRHPFYGCAGLLILANALMAANWFLLLAGVVFVCLIVVRTRTEEENLVARFGDAYRAYMRQTGRFFPRLLANRPGA
jgi:protein-S-isoprenylcysteine O-methyltransferase Ste14